MKKHKSKSWRVVAYCPKCGARGYSRQAFNPATGHTNDSGYVHCPRCGLVCEA